MRIVTVTITYDMDDTVKSLKDELKDWIRGDISVQDLGLHPIYGTPEPEDKYTSIEIKEASNETND